MPAPAPNVPDEPEAADAANAAKPESEKEEKPEMTWIDLYDGLYRARAIFLFQELTQEVTANITGIMVYLNIDDARKEQYLFINSTGGKMVNGLSVYNTSRAIRPDVTTLGLGVAASMAALVLAGGALTKRIAYPSARVMLHQPKVKLKAKPDYSVAAAQQDVIEIRRLRRSILFAYAKVAKRPLWILIKDIERDAHMTADEAKSYGIIDEIIEEGFA
uniref:ATP-dependent Clp protease proteolytic subunit n=1 Tax=Cyananthus flavus TaxID=1334528 RepID=A0A8F3JDJ9_9ASTR|nr:ATP-dependent protease proteolytic subunit [Cyananthus flavus]